ncbi:hypothetical protein R84B8_00983 [Treponema sp. R8-4-B8]
MAKTKWKYHHIGVPTEKSIAGEHYLKDYKLYHYGFEESEFGIEWMRYEKECNLPEIVKTKPHLAFEVKNLKKALKGRKIIIEPNSPSEGNVVAFIEEDGLPIELIQIDKNENKK